MTQEHEIAVIVVTYNSADLIPQFARGLIAACRSVDARVVVVDNASVDGTRDVAADLLPAADVVAMERNGGYSAGINAGIEHVRVTGGARVYVVSNPDMTLSEGTLAGLAAGLQDERVGIVAPHLRDEYDRTLPSLREAPSVVRTWCDAVVGGRLAAALRLPTEVIRGSTNYAAARDAVWATGGLLAIAARCVEAVGPWDESYFMYEEEVDFCLRARAAGFVLRYVPDACANRFIGPGRARPWAQAMMRRNRAVLARKYFGRASARLIWAGLLLGDSIRAVAGRREARAAVWALLHSPDPQRILARYGG